MAPQIVRVGTQAIQEAFENEGLREPALFGIEVIDAKIREPGPNAPDDLTVGSTSVMLSYRSAATGEEVAEAHVYRYPDGSPRGTPDPKYVKSGGTIFVLDRSLDDDG